MSAIGISTHRKLPGYLISTKEIGDDQREIETPTRARLTDLQQTGEELHRAAYGIAEVSFEVSSQDLNDLAEPPNVEFEKSVATAADAVHEDEFGVAVVKYTGRGIVNIPGMEALVSILDEHFQVLVGPLMSEQLDSVDDLDANPEPYNRFLENMERTLGAVETAADELSVLGTIPVLSWDRMEELLDLHFEKKVGGFCVDFLDKKPTARHRITGCIAPLMKRLGKEQSYRSSLLYAVNAYRGKNRTGRPRYPAEDYFVFGLGFDVLGGRYYFSGSGGGGYEEIRFRCFDSETYELEYVLLDALPDELPQRTGFDHEYILENARDDEQRGRVSVLLEAEQMALAYDDLRDAIHAGRTAEFVTEKDGTLGRIETLMETVQDAYDEGRSSPSVTSY